MPQFDESKDSERIAQLRDQEEETLAHILSRKYGVNYTDLSMVSINTDALRLVPEEKARDANVAVFEQTNKQISIAVQSPQNPKTDAVLQELSSDGYDVIVFMVSTNSLERAWEKYKDLSHASASKRGSLEISNTDIKDLIAGVKTLSDAKATIEGIMNMKRAYRTSRVVEILLASAMALGASDLHVEPEDEFVRLRFRLDGILTEITTFDVTTYQLFLSRVKLLSGLKLNVKNSAQDGRFGIELDQKNIEIRTSILPSEYGESIVLRLLDPRNIMIPLEELGLNEELFNVIEHEITQPNGLMITTGPTGSGKTTMLYAFLRKIYNPNIKIITLEDPIEYHLDGIVQTQVDEKKGYTFESGLRSILRQDPDVIMVGEMRDIETAKTAINASLTGHMVFSTLHTNNAAGAIPRLIELGVDPSIIPSSLKTAMAQRLVRKLCTSCKKKVPLEGAQKNIIENILKDIPEKYIKETIDRSSIWDSVGCEKCGESGFKGRLGVFEAIFMDENIEEIIGTNPTERTLAEGAKQQGMLTMAQDGVLKVMKGVTSLKELMRVVELE